MRVFITACAAAIVIALVGVVALDAVQKPANKAFSTTGARI